MDAVSIEDFQKLDIRIGTVTKAEVPEWSHWVMKLEVDLGSELGVRSIFAGLMKHYKPKDLEGKQFPFVVNIEPKKIGPEGDYSNGMLMAADLVEEDPASLKLRGASDGKPILFKLQEKVPNGTRIR